MGSCQTWRERPPTLLRERELAWKLGHLPTRRKVSRVDELPLGEVGQAGGLVDLAEDQVQGRLVGILGQSGEELAPGLGVETIAEEIAGADDGHARVGIAGERGGDEDAERLPHARGISGRQDLELGLLDRLPRGLELPEIADAGLERGRGGGIGDRASRKIRLLPEKPLGGEHANAVAQGVRAGPLEGDRAREDLGVARGELDYSLRGYGAHREREIGQVLLLAGEKVGDPAHETP